MKQGKQLPSAKELEGLVTGVDFPASSRLLQRAAEDRGLAEHVIAFVSLFPADEVFVDRTDFLTRCEELKLFILEQRKMPKEFLRSPVG